MTDEKEKTMDEINKEVAEEQEGKSLDELAGEGHIVGHDEEMPTEVAEAANTLAEAIDKVYLTPEQQQGRDILDGLKDKAPTTEEEIMKPVDFKTGIFGMRGDIELVKSKVKNWQGHPALEPVDPNPLFEHQEEMKANLTLAYRHLEDARMRLGKAVQAYDGGKSCYPR